MFAARLPDRARERNGTAVSGCPISSSKFAHGRLDRRFARLDRAFRYHPGAFVLVAPEGTAGPDQQDFDLLPSAHGKAGFRR